MSSTDPVRAQGNVAVITGGASGIGLAVAERLLRCEMKLVLADVDEPKVRAVEARMVGADVVRVVCDTSNADSVLCPSFWILTHADTRRMPVERMQRAAAGTNPPMIGAD